MRRIICECELCNDKKVFLDGETEQGFLTLKVEPIGSIFVCDDCECKLFSLKSHEKKKLVNNFLIGMKEKVFLQKED